MTLLVKAIVAERDPTEGLKAPIAAVAFTCSKGNVNGPPAVNAVAPILTVTAPASGEAFTNLTANFPAAGTGKRFVEGSASSSVSTRKRIPPTSELARGTRPIGTIYAGSAPPLYFFTRSAMSLLLLLPIDRT